MEIKTKTKEKKVTGPADEEVKFPSAVTTKKLDSRFLARENGVPDIEVVRTEGSLFFDSEGKRYIDFLMGWCVGNSGWANEEIIEEIRAFKGPEYVYPHFLYNPWAELAGMLADICPPNLVKSFRATGGTEAIEMALKIAMCYTERSKFLSVEGCYHGNSIGALSIGASYNRSFYPNLLQGCYKVDLPLDAKALKKIETRLKRKDVAAFIMEPVIINLGILVPEKSFMQDLDGLCKEYGTLLVMDEVATGFGRTGRLFASEHFGIEPDVMCIAKAFSGGYGAIGAAITTERIARQVQSKISGYSTFGWHPVSVNAAIANIRYLLNHKEELLQNTEEISDLFRSHLSSMNFMHKPEEFRIKGLAIGVDVGSGAYAKQIEQKCLMEGLLVSSIEEILVMFPALNIDKETAEEGLNILERCL